MPRNRDQTGETGDFGIKRESTDHGSSRIPCFRDHCYRAIIKAGNSPFVRECAAAPEDSESKAFPTTTPSSNFGFGGYTAGNSKNTTSLNCETKTTGTTAGWRILSIAGNTVTLIHGGTPECYYHPAVTGQPNFAYNSQRILTSITTGTLNNGYTSAPRDWSGYVNTTYATTATAFTKGMLDSYMGSTVGYGTTITDSLIKIGTTYYLGSPASSTALFGISGSGYITGYSYRVFGIRPVVTLKTTVKANGKDANGAWKISL